MGQDLIPTTADLTDDVSFRAFHTFIRGTRRAMDAEILASAETAYQAEAKAAAEPPKAGEPSLAILDRLPGFQLHSWGFRNLQRFKYLHPGWGIIPAAERERERLEATLAEAQARGLASGHLKLDPEIDYPDYYRHVDFHQHPGGVWRDKLAGVVYDVARQTTISSHLDPMAMYRALFASLPQDRHYDRVLDWGCGHGAGLLTWMEQHPESEGHGVDISEPCLTFAWAKAEERGLKPYLTQQDIAHLDYPDNHFDLLFFVFMLHEIPPGPTPEILREVARVLKPGGLFFGAEFRPMAGAFETTVMTQLQWCNNEVFTPAFFKFPYVEKAKSLGFSSGEIRPFERMKLPRSPDAKAPVISEFTLFNFQK